MPIREWTAYVPATDLARGTKIEIAVNQTTVDLPNAVEVQPR